MTKRAGATIVVVLLLASAALDLFLRNGDDSTPNSGQLNVTDETQPEPVVQTVPTLRVEPNVVSPGDAVSLHISIPDSGRWTYGYVAKLQEHIDGEWQKHYTLFLGMVEDRDEQFGQPSFTKRGPYIVRAIGFTGDRVARLKVPPVKPGNYRVVMSFGYDREQKRPRARADAEFRVE